MTTPRSPHATRPGDEVAPRPAEFRSLTGLRIVAAAWVVLFHFHFTGLDGVGAAVDVLGPLVTAGALGVDLFFVLSGFVVAHTYLDRLGPALRLRPTAHFVWARACRIWPAYALVFHLFAIWVVARLVWGADDRVAFQAVQPVVSLPEYLQQLVLVQLWDAPFFDGASWVGSTWSISAEWLAYLLFPVAALVFHRLRDLPVALLAAGSLALMTPIAWAYLLTGSPYHPWSWAVRVLCGFGAGVLAHLVVRRLQSDGRACERVRRWASALAAALPPAVAAGLVAGELVGPGRGGAVLVVFPVLVGALALADRGPATWLAKPAMVYGGRVSYSLYLVHIPMFEVFWLAQEHFPQALGRSTDLGHAVGLAVLLATVPVAGLVHGVVEEPARLRLARLCPTRFATRRTRPDTAPARPIVFIPAPVGPVRSGWGSAAVAPHPRSGSLHRRIAPGSRTVTVTEYVQRVL
ncbi:MAG: acyltransferase family protein [Pseudonocardia sp.]